MDWLTDGLADSLSHWLTDWVTTSLTHRQTQWLTCWLTDWCTDLLTDWLTDWLTDILTDLLTDLLTNFQANWLADWPTINYQLTVLLIMSWLTDSRRLIDWLAGSLTHWLGWCTEIHPTKWRDSDVNQDYWLLMKMVIFHLRSDVSSRCVKTSTARS